MATSKHFANYGPLTAVISEVITQKQARIQVDHPKGRDIFEYDDSSERRDQFRNAVCFCVAMKDKDEIRNIIDATDPEKPERVGLDNGRIVHGRDAR